MTQQQHEALVLGIPPSVPRTARRPFVRWLALAILRAGGWRIVGEVPDLPKAVVIAAPHSSNWDGLWAFAAKVAMGLEVLIFAKHQLFWWPLGVLLGRVGLIAVDRNAASGLVGQVVQRFETESQLWVALAPEGTRKRVSRWKSGFWKIAKGAGVPVVPAYFHYPDKVIGFGEPFVLTDDMDADIARIRAWYAPWQGRNHSV